MAELRGSDIALVREQLGREPTTPFEVMARCSGCHTLVVRNRPFGASGKPFPTLYWLTCPDAVRAVSALESEGWIDRLEREFDPEAIAGIHRAYAEERARLAPEARSWGGVGGTATGLKCLHAHYAYHVVGGEDAVGAWVAHRVEPLHEEGLRVAAVDLGTNSIRLIVAEPGDDGGPAELARDMVIT